MKSRQIALSLSLLSVVALAGCETEVGSFAEMSTKNLYARNVDIASLPKKAAEGKKTAFFGSGANVQAAAELCEQNGGGNVILDATVYREDSVFVSGYLVKGTVINIPYASPDSPMDSPR
jgi:hypothetical protein